MEQFLYTLVIIFGFILVSFFLINIRHIFTGKEFRGTCSSNNPMLNKKLGACSVCGSKSGQDCQMPEVKSKDGSGKQSIQHMPH